MRWTIVSALVTGVSLSLLSSLDAPPNGSNARAVAAIIQQLMTSADAVTAVPIEKA